MCETRLGVWKKQGCKSDYRDPKALWTQTDQTWEKDTRYRRPLVCECGRNVLHYYNSKSTYTVQSHGGLVLGTTGLKARDILGGRQKAHRFKHTLLFRDANTLQYWLRGETKISERKLQRLPTPPSPRADSSSLTPMKDVQYPRNLLARSSATFTAATSKLPFSKSCCKHPLTVNKFPSPRNQYAKHSRQVVWNKHTQEAGTGTEAQPWRCQATTLPTRPQ